MKGIILSVIVGLLTGFSGVFESYGQAPRKESDKPHLAAALADSIVDVDVNFSGTRVTLFAVSDLWDNPNVAFAVALVGPHRPYAVIKHDEDTTQRFEFVSAPAVLAVAAEHTLQDIASPDSLIAAGVNPRYAALPAPDQMENPNLDMWRHAFAELKAQDGLFRIQDAGLERLEGGLIRADIDLPAAAPPGDYDVRIFLFEEGVLLAEAETPLELKREGVEHALYGLSNNHPILYGLLSVLTGCLVGAAAAYLGGRR